MNILQRSVFTLLGALALLLSSGPALAMQELEWKTDFGPMALTIDDDGTAEGKYPDYTGKLYGSVEDNENRFVGYWVQPRSELRCSEKRHGSAFWGQVIFTGLSEASLKGKWSYCDKPPGTHGAWNGVLTRRHVKAVAKRMTPEQERAYKKAQKEFDPKLMRQNMMIQMLMSARAGLKVCQQYGSPETSDDLVDMFIDRAARKGATADQQQALRDTLEDMTTTFQTQMAPEANSERCGKMLQKWAKNAARWRKKIMDSE
ncbi:hypothetical protein [Magnetofaba australis]|uniref:Uncharacterized protein n=1 Tax=Magnetofaba australis IT-1 TaxID=1434232 RepID=A0A1Y2K948_9PROT|nr:hypothetical protein [Magnetofaba australis]OSM07139.1 hypothetical protein MAIT1_03946 [Magnetofaba australis IT-1]